MTDEQALCILVTLAEHEVARQVRAGTAHPHMNEAVFKAVVFIRHQGIDLSTIGTTIAELEMDK